MLTPPALRRGSKVRIIAPSGPFSRPLFWRALGWLSKYYRPIFDPTIFKRDGFLAGSDERRRLELQFAIDDPDTSAIVVARGGWGAARLTSGVDFSGLISHPKWIVGYSDPTTLHICAWQIGVASMHANNLVGLGRGDAEARNVWLEALEFPEKCRNVGRPAPLRWKSLGSSRRRQSHGPVQQPRSGQTSLSRQLHFGSRRYRRVVLPRRSHALCVGEFGCDRQSRRFRVRTVHRL